jgi:glycerol-3-phosphate acyltransferase PlsY
MQIAGCGLKLQRLLGEENLMLPFWSAVIIAIIASYLFGCFNGAIVISKYVLHNDVRKHGSGNAGITNFYRTFGGPLTFLVLLCDVLKMVGGYFWPVFCLRRSGFIWKLHILRDCLLF